MASSHMIFWPIFFICIICIFFCALYILPMWSLLFEHSILSIWRRLLPQITKLLIVHFFSKSLFYFAHKIRTYSHTHIFFTCYKSSESLLIYFQRPGWSSNWQVFKFQMKNTVYAEHRPKSRSFKQIFKYKMNWN